MSIIYVLIPLAVIIVAIAIAAFFWAVRSNQFEDLERQGYSILFDDDIDQDSSTSSDKAHNLEEKTTESKNVQKKNAHQEKTNQ